MPWATTSRGISAGSVAGELIVTDGARGATWFADDATITATPPPVAVRDTTGSGDNFHSAFALGLARGMGREELLAFAVATATLSCREYGGRRGIPTYDEAREAAARVTIQRGPGLPRSNPARCTDDGARTR